MITCAGYYSSALCFGTNQEAPVVSEMISREWFGQMEKLSLAYLRSSLFTTPLGYKAIYNRFLWEGMFVEYKSEEEKKKGVKRRTE